MLSWKKVLEYLLYTALVFFYIPIEYDKTLNKNENFEEYIRKFNKTYTNATVYQMRLKAFQNSLKNIDLLNSNAESAAVYGLTKFSDMLPREFEEYLSSRPFSNLVKTKTDIITKRDIRYLPKAIDWRNKSVVTNVHNQLNCGACWAFSAIETLESMYAIKTGKLLELSVQQMIDCSENNNGCFGGDTSSLLEWIKINNIAVSSAAKYPLTLKNDKCKKSKITNNTVQMEDYWCGNLINSEESILSFLAQHGPVAVAINAQTWQNYIGGTIQYHCDGNPLKLNHAVQIVGYNLNAKVPYYIARNSWGKDFGEMGYVRLAIGKNTCGLADDVCVLKVL